MFYVLTTNKSVDKSFLDSKRGIFTTTNYWYYYFQPFQLNWCYSTQVISSVQSSIIFNASGIVGSHDSGPLQNVCSCWHDSHRNSEEWAPPRPASTAACIEEVFVAMFQQIIEDQHSLIDWCSYHSTSTLPPPNKNVIYKRRLTVNACLKGSELC